MVDVTNPDRTPPPRGLVRLLAEITVMVALTSLGVLSFVWLVPEGNDYALATLDKHSRLERSGPRKLVLGGGANLAFGIESEALERGTGIHVVNMGMNGYFGVRYMLAEVERELNAADIVVLSFEYDSFFKSVDGTPSDLLMITKANPKAFSYLSPQQRWDVVAATPFVAQHKALRLVRETAGFVRTTASRLLGRGDPGSGYQLISSIESRAGFNEYGDLTSHLDVEWPYGREGGLDLSNIPRDEDVVPMLQDFAARMQKRGVTTILSYTPVLRYFYEFHEASLQRLHRDLLAATPLIVPSPPEAFIFTEDDAFDTVYHLNRGGRAVRTERLLNDLLPVVRAPSKAQ